ncbi:hypothetical protein GCM10008106_31580 [Mongoliitalea lutea]|uniref:Uncharacterized protein n=1 Tax=Mongoliitalea lutea TaxID=849756 RepID=A0A8J3CYF7_9BACT|nr:hypothetical protein GCM10008106_31580 [Mongoliitalea lutea]
MLDIGPIIVNVERFTAKNQPNFFKAKIMSAFWLINIIKKINVIHRKVKYKFMHPSETLDFKFL